MRDTNFVPCLAMISVLKLSTKHAFLSLLLLGFSLAIPAQEPPSQTIQVDMASKHFDAPRTEIAPVIDGVIDGDPAWAGAHQIDDFYQVRPNEYLPASDKTEFLITYDSSNLYVAARVYYRNKNDIIANVLRQGAATGSDDRISLILDPYGDGRRGYLFILNSNSVRVDSLFVGTSSTQPNWEGIWQGQATSTDYGWSGEIQIPFKTLSFDPDAATWGINFRRDSELTSERMGWYSQNQAMDPGASGTMTALRDINQGWGLDIEPSISLIKHKNNETGESSSSFEPSLDAFYKITPALNGALTINTDFSATEVDDRQVNLTQFSLFFPEKREFFLRDFDIFDFGNIGANEQRTSFGRAERQNARPFFSRRVGLARSGDPIGIDAGVKVSGDVAGLNVGALVIRQEEFEALNATDLFVGRVTKNILEESSIGVIYTNGDPRSNSNNNLIGADFRYRNTRLGRGRAFTADAWYQQTSGDIELDDEYAFDVKLAVPSTTGFGGKLQYQEVGENYNPALGFVSRKGVRLKRAKIFHNTLSADHIIQRYNPSAEYISWEYLDTGQVQTRITKFQALDLTNQSGDRIWGYWSRREASVRGINDQPLESIGIIFPTGNYAWTRWAIGISTSNHRKVFTSTRAFFGGYYNGNLMDIRSDITWRPSEHFNFSFGVRHSNIEQPQGRFISRLVDFNATWVFSSKLSWSNLVQYDNISENLGFNSRLHWVPKAGQDVFLVFNQGWQDRDLDNTFAMVERDLTFKASYTFRF
ncbi:MAG: carbohydrate binding family 9 domain-containing protein [Proteobacteria bacterium]|nr:carbohydrate binding family 9 domain-containing protein [Pseudomonadota bacterium]